MTRQETIRFLTFKTLGNFLILFALYGVGATFGPALYYEVQFRIDQVRGVHYTIAEPSGFGQLLKNRPASLFAFNGKDQVLIPYDTNFSILIPKLGASAKVFANTDPINPDNYLPVLKKGVAHAQGTALPGESGSVYLFAHSTDNFWDVGLYNAIFYLLKDLQKGDDVTLFYQNKRYNYTVVDNKITDANDVSYIVQSKKAQNQLVLQTCWPPGTTWKRLIVVAKPS